MTGSGPMSRPAGGVRRRLAVVVATFAVTIAACGIPVGEPDVLDTDGHEDLLLGTTTSTTIVDPAETRQFRLFFLNPRDELETIERTFVAGAAINDVLRSLEQPPQADEQPVDEEVGLLRSLVPDGLDATLLEETPAEAVQGVRVIQVNPEAMLRQSLDEAPDQARLIVKQLVCTFLGIAPEGTVGIELHDDQGELPLTDDAAQPIEGATATEEDFGDCKTGTEERLELVEEAGSEEASTTSADGGASNDGGG